MFTFKIIAVLLLIQVAKASWKYASGRELPYLAYITKMENGTLTYGCQAALIREDYLLLPANCVKDLLIDELQLKALVGYDLVDEPNYIHHAIPIKKITIHEKYVQKDKRYDLALVKLGRKVEVNDDIKLVKLPEANSDVNEGTYLRDTAYISDCDSCWKAMYTRVLVIDRQACEKELGIFYGVLHKSQFCVKSVVNVNEVYPNSILVETNGSDFVLIGLVTRNNLVAARISNYVDWIQNQMNSDNKTIVNKTDHPLINSKNITMMNHTDPLMMHRDKVPMVHYTDKRTIKSRIEETIISNNKTIPNNYVTGGGASEM